MSEVRITISGEEDTGKSMIGRVISHALSDAGFVDVVHLDQSSSVIDTPKTGKEVKTLLDLCRETRPDIFESPIIINEISISEDAVDARAIRDHEELEQAMMVVEATET